MRVPDNEYDLFNFDDFVEGAIVSVLNAQQFLKASPNAQGKRGTNTNLTPRIMLNLSVEGVEGQRKNRFTGASQFQPFDTWKFKLTADIVSNATTQARTITGFTHAGFLAWTRWSLQLYRLMDASRWTEDIAPYHVINEIAEQGDAVEFSDENGTNTTMLNFSGTFSIRGNSWRAICLVSPP